CPLWPCARTSAGTSARSWLSRWACLVSPATVSCPRRAWRLTGRGSSWRQRSMRSACAPGQPSTPFWITSWDGDRRKLCRPSAACRATQEDPMAHVISADGTAIGYDRLGGDGPALVLVGGGLDDGSENVPRGEHLAAAG